MNMLVQPAPFPEEMDRGYLGRIMRINGYRTPKDVVEAMAAHFGEEGRSRRDLTTHELLSRMAGMTTEHFAQRHTTLPLRRGIAKPSVPGVDDLLAQYVAAKGVHSAVAQLLELPLHTVRKALCDLGLPSLPEWDETADVGPVAALKAYYLDKLSYTSCLKIAGVTEARFDALMRQCSPKMAIALGRMSLKTSIRPRAHQAKGRLPVRLEQGAVLATPQFRETLLQN